MLTAWWLFFRAQGCKKIPRGAQRWRGCAFRGVCLFGFLFFLFAFLLAFFVVFLFLVVFVFFVVLFVFWLVFFLLVFLFLVWFFRCVFVFHFSEEAVDDVHLCLSVLAHHLGVKTHCARDQRIVVFAETFLELVDVVEGVAVDAQALVETADAQILLGELVIGQRAEKFKEVAAGFAEGTQAFDGLEVGEVGGEDGFFDEVVAAGELFAGELFQRRGFCGGHEGGDGLVKGFVVVFFAVFTAEVVAEVHDGAVLLDDHGVGKGEEFQLAGVVDGFEDGVDAAEFFQVVVEGEVEAFGFVEGFEVAVWLDELQEGVLAAQSDAQRAQCVAVVGIVEKGVARLDDLFVLALDERRDADADRNAEKIEGFHLVEVDACDADGAFRRMRRQIEHFAAAFFEMHVEAGHGAHPVAEIWLVADDDEGVAVFVAADGVGESVEIAILQKWLDFRRNVRHITAEHLGGLQRAGLWRCPDFAA